MIGIVLLRLQQAGIDLKKMGIILIGDAAQLLPIGGEPLWSVKLKRTDGKDYHQNSYHGLNDFREAFGRRNSLTFQIFIHTQLTTLKRKQRLLNVNKSHNSLNLHMKVLMMPYI